MAARGENTEPKTLGRQMNPEVKKYFKELTKKAGSVKSDKKTAANRKKLADYWERVRSGEIVHRGRGKKKRAEDGNNP